MNDYLTWIYFSAITCAFITGLNIMKARLFIEKYGDLTDHTANSQHPLLSGRLTFFILSFVVSLLCAFVNILYIGYIITSAKINNTQDYLIIISTLLLLILSTKLLNHFGKELHKISETIKMNTTLNQFIDNIIKKYDDQIIDAEVVAESFKRI